VLAIASGLQALSVGIYRVAFTLGHRVIVTFDHYDRPTMGEDYSRSLDRIGVQRSNDHSVTDEWHYDHLPFRARRALRCEALAYSSARTLDPQVQLMR
jgi:hypothetical protein